MIYEYECQCGNYQTEMFSVENRNTSVKCKKCGEEMMRIISLPKVRVKESLGFDPAEMNPEKEMQAWERKNQTGRYEFPGSHKAKLEAKIEKKRKIQVAV